MARLGHWQARGRAVGKMQPELSKRYRPEPGRTELKNSRGLLPCFAINDIRKSTKTKPTVRRFCHKPRSKYIRMRTDVLSRNGWIQREKRHFSPTEKVSPRKRKKQRALVNHPEYSKERKKKPWKIYYNCLKTRAFFGVVLATLCYNTWTEKSRAYLIDRTIVLDLISFLVGANL